MKVIGSPFVVHRNLYSLAFYDWFSGENFSINSNENVEFPSNTIFNKKQWALKDINMKARDENNDVILLISVYLLCVFLSQYFWIKIIKKMTKLKEQMLQGNNLFLFVNVVKNLKNYVEQRKLFYFWQLKRFADIIYSLFLFLKPWQRMSVLDKALMNYILWWILRRWILKIDHNEDFIMKLVLKLHNNTLYSVNYFKSWVLE